MPHWRGCELWGNVANGRALVAHALSAVAGCFGGEWGRRGAGPVCGARGAVNTRAAQHFAISCRLTGGLAAKYDKKRCWTPVFAVETVP